MKLKIRVLFHDGTAEVYEADKAEWFVDHGPGGNIAFSRLELKREGSIVAQFRSEGVIGWVVA